MTNCTGVCGGKKHTVHHMGKMECSGFSDKKLIETGKKLLTIPDSNAIIYEYAA